MRVVELIDFPEGTLTTARTRFLNDTLIICCDVCFDLTQQRVVHDVTVKP